MQLITRKLGRTNYQQTLTDMRAFTSERTKDTLDELWLTEHDSVYTLGLNRKNTRLPNNDIPIINTDRGGKITYHGLGQVIIYLLIDLGRRKLTVRQLVDIIENSIINLLTQHEITAITRKGAPGVYVGDKKIASVGLRLKNNCCYHGLSLNVNMDLSPFKDIDPCGYAGLEITQTKNLMIKGTPTQLGETLLEILKNKITT